MGNHLRTPAHEMVSRWTRSLDKAVTKRGKVDLEVSTTIKGTELQAAMEFAKVAQKRFPEAKVEVMTPTDVPVAGDKVTVRVRSEWMSPRQKRWSAQVNKAKAEHNGAVPDGFQIGVRSANQGEARELTHELNRLKSAGDPEAVVLRDRETGRHRIEFRSSRPEKQSPVEYEWSAVPELQSKLGAIRKMKGVDSLGRAISTGYAPGGWTRVLTVYHQPGVKVNEKAIRAKVKESIPNAVVNFADVPDY